MDHFAYRAVSQDARADNPAGSSGRAETELVCEWIAARELGARYGTPLLVYSSSTLVDRFYSFVEAFAPLRAMVAQPVGTSGRTAVLRTLVERGAGLTASSGGELERAWASGAQFSRVLLGGLSKRPDEIRAALDGLYSPLYTAGRLVEGKPPYYRGPVGWVVAETVRDLESIAEVVASQRIVCRVLLRMRCTGSVVGFSSVEAGDAVGRYANDRCLRITGLACGVPDPSRSHERLAEALELAAGLRAGGAFIDTLWFGDGFAGPVSWAPDEPQAVAGVIRALRDEVEHRGTKIILSPGAGVCARAGVLLTRVLEIIDRGNERFAVCDAGTHAVPPLPGLDRFVWPVRVGEAQTPGFGRAVRSMEGLRPVTLLGPSGRVGDVLAESRALPPIGEGDLLAVFQCGAETMSRAATRADRALPAEVMVAHSVARVVRDRRSIDAVLHDEPEDGAREP